MIPVNINKRGKYNNAKTGIFKPLNPNKYNGQVPIVFKSQLEYLAMRYLDSNPSIISWSYESQSIKQIGRDGHNIQEAQEKYENSRTGEQKATHSRHLDGKGQKMIKKRNRLTGETESQNILNGIKEEELGDFDKKYNDYREKVDFKKNYQFFNNQMRTKGNENKEKVKMLPSSKEENN